jgi:hypothetical protein
MPRKGGLLDEYLQSLTGRTASPQDPAPVHPGMAAGAERHQLSVVAAPAVMHIQIVSGVTAAASPSVANREPNPGCLQRNAPNTAGAGNSSCTARRPPLFHARRSKAATLDPPPRLRAAGPGAASRSGGRRSVRRGPANGLAAAFRVGFGARQRALASSRLVQATILRISCARHSKTVEHSSITCARPALLRSAG